MYEGAEKASELDALYRDMNRIRESLSESNQLFAALDNPLWQAADKIAALEAVAKKLNFCQSSLNTLKILAENKKLSLLPEIIEQFTKYFQELHNIAEVEVTTVIPLNAQQQNLLQTKLMRLFHKEKIILRYIINPQIIGGLIIKYGTNFIDNSVKHKLHILEQLMKGIK